MVALTQETQLLKRSQVSGGLVGVSVVGIALLVAVGVGVVTLGDALLLLGCSAADTQSAARQVAAQSSRREAPDIVSSAQASRREAAANSSSVRRAQAASLRRRPREARPAGARGGHVTARRAGRGRGGRRGGRDHGEAGSWRRGGAGGRRHLAARGQRSVRRERPFLSQEDHARPKGAFLTPTPRKFPLPSGKDGAAHVTQRGACTCAAREAGREGVT